MPGTEPCEPPPSSLTIRDPKCKTMLSTSKASSQPKSQQSTHVLSCMTSQFKTKSVVHNDCGSDFPHFTCLYSMIFAPGRVKAPTNRRTSNHSLSSHPSSGKSNVCHCFNSVNSCSLSDKDHKYRHACKLCRKIGHSKTECGEKRRQ